MEEPSMEAEISQETGHESGEGRPNHLDTRLSHVDLQPLETSAHERHSEDTSTGASLQGNPAASRGVVCNSEPLLRIGTEKEVYRPTSDAVSQPRPSPTIHLAAPLTHSLAPTLMVDPEARWRLGTNLSNALMYSSNIASPPLAKWASDGSIGFGSHANPTDAVNTKHISCAITRFELTLRLIFTSDPATS
ncbi:hypothetical protein R1flu_007966 [Riccia fluitans]|uniref:Uncharacterized protein n=1 Tax=Riccia fluitans TaxID=41844 RepID=A0ABD1YAC2_9MARC